MTKPNEATCDRILIVEGYSDLLFFAEFLKHLKKSDGVFIKPFKGKNNILNRNFLEVELAPDVLTKKKSIGIVIDADENPEGTIQSLTDSLKAILDRDVAEGEWSNGEPRVGFFVTPDGTSPGEIETLVWDVWSEKQEHSAGKESVLTHLLRMEAAGWPAKSPDKARIGAFLAAAFDDDPRLGAGAREGLFDFDAAGYARLRKFLLEFSQ